MNNATFYADSHIGARFGARGPAWATYHHGQDINGWPAGTQIPSWTAGVVHARFWSAALGYVVQIKRSDGWIVSYCHLQTNSPLPLGTKVNIGTIIGRLGNTGTQSTGPHLHTTLEPTVVIGTSRARDPLPYIKSSRTSTAGGGVTPIPDPPKPINKDTDMRIIYNLDAPAAEEDTRRAIIGELSFQVITAAQSTRERKFWGDPVNVTVGEWNAARDLVVARRTALGLPVVIGENGSVLDLSDLPTKDELGQALTSTVALVNDHADANKAEILDAIDSTPSGGTSGGNYTLSLNIDGVPGTANGTATPA